MADKLTPKQEAFAQKYVELGNASEAYRFAYDGPLVFMPPKSNAYVYMLVRLDTNQIVYFGKGRGKRMHHHMRDVRNGKISGLKKHQGLRRLHEDNVDVLPYVVEANLTDEKALHIEASLIKAVGRDSLLNSTLSKGHHLQRAREQAMHGLKMFDPAKKHLPLAKKFMQELYEVIDLCESGLDEKGLPYECA
jgi:hypothetical protein